MRVKYDPLHPDLQRVNPLALNDSMIISCSPPPSQVKLYVFRLLVAL